MNLSMPRSRVCGSASPFHTRGCPSMSCDIDLATGEVTHEGIDIDLPSLIPISFGRLYVSTSSGRSALGPGWSHTWQRWARFAPEGLLIHDGYDEDRIFPFEQCNGEDGPNILREGRTLRLSFPDGSRQDYYALGDRDAKWWLVQLVDVDGNYVQIHYDRENIARLISSEGHRLSSFHTSCAACSARSTSTHVHRMSRGRW